MKFVTIASKKDEAGKNIFRHIHKDQTFLNHYMIEEESINADEIGNRFNDYDFIIFATKHESKKGKPSLTVHAPGNWGKARFGGKKGEVCKTSSRFLKCLFNSLNKEAKNSGLNSKYNVTLEVTHHGPYLEKLCCFIEIGSSEKEWQDKNAGEVVARSIKRSINSFENRDYNDSVPVIGIGGPHYAPNFTKIQKNSKYALSHIIPQYVFPINKEMLEQAINKTEEDVRTAIIDWKGLKSKERQEAINLLNSLGLEYKRSNNVEK